MHNKWRLAASVLAAVVALTLGLRASDDITAPDAELQFQLGTLLLEESRYDEAFAAFEKARQSPDRGLAVRARKGTIRAALSIAEFGKAQTEAEALRRDAPTDPEVLTLYGDSMWAAGLFDEAEEVYRAVLQRHPGSSRARYGLARSLATSSKLDEALAEALAASAAAPRDREIHHEVGGIYERLQMYPEAVSAYTNFINLLPNKDRSERAEWSRSQVRFLEAFEGKTPLEITSSPELRHTVPFRLQKGKILVDARVNGRRLDLVLDTGSEEIVMSETTASRMGVRAVTFTLSAGVGDVGLRGLRLGRMDSLEIGSLKVSHVPVLIKTPGLEGLPTRESDSFSPLALGLSVTIDYERGFLTLAHQLDDEPSDVTLPMRVNRLAMVRGLLNDEHPAYFVVDTGGEVISISLATAGSLNMRPVRHIPLRVYGVSGWDRDAFLLPGVDLAFREIEYRNFSVVVLNLRMPSVLLGFELGGIVGHKFLEPYRVSMDLARSELRLHRR